MDAALHVDHKFDTPYCKKQHVYFTVQLTQETK